MENQRQLTGLWLFSFLFVLASPSLVSAHTAVGGVDGLLNGFAHPFGGLDHLCAMLGVGVWVAQRGGAPFGSSRWPSWW